MYLFLYRLIRFGKKNATTVLRGGMNDNNPRAFLHNYEATIRGRVPNISSPRKKCDPRVNKFKAEDDFFYKQVSFSLEKIPWC